MMPVKNLYQESKFLEGKDFVSLILIWPALTSNTHAREVNAVTLGDRSPMINYGGNADVGTGVSAP